MLLLASPTEIRREIPFTFPPPMECIIAPEKGGVAGTLQVTPLSALNNICKTAVSLPETINRPFPKLSESRMGADPENIVKELQVIPSVEVLPMMVDPNTPAAINTPFP